MFSKTTQQVVSVSAVSAMVVVAWGEFQHGALVSDVHLITPAQLTVMSTAPVSGFEVAVLHQNATIESEYAEPPDTRALRLDGVTLRSS